MGLMQDVMKKTLQDVLKQGESLDELLLKSKDISMQTREFYHTSKKANSGCFSCFGC